MKTFLKFVLLAAALNSLFGCAIQRTLYQSQSETFSIPALDVVATASPGESLLSQGRRRVYDAININQPVSIDNFILPTGNYIKQSESSIFDYYTWDEVSHPTRGGIFSDGQHLKAVMILRKGEMTCVETFTSKIYCSSSVKFQKVTTTVQDQESFQMTLLYSGKIGNKINLSYREFSGSLARAAFSNAVEYDLSESSVLSYKGSLIEVLEATNQIIRYKVLRNFTQ